MKQTLRDYQERAVRRVREEWEKHRAVCLVAPTGSGKTTMGAELVGSTRTVWIAHRRELIKQAADRLESCGVSVGCVCPGMPEDEHAQVQVCTVQTLLASGHRPPAELLVLDECHHYAPAAGEWTSLREAYPNSRVLGLTATPQRRDGSPLGDVFQALVEAASYSELVLAGHLTECHVYAAPEGRPGNGWSTDPIDAYRTHANGTRAFMFVNRVHHCHEWAAKFSVAGIPAVAVDGTTPKKERAEALSRFESGDALVLVNVNTMTEGVDVPAAATCILGRSSEHASGYLQMVGRILRPYPGKTHATLIDLVDATHQHGYPTEDRRYSLDGNAITLTRDVDLVTCLNCGAIHPASTSCPRCSFKRPVKEPPPVLIYSLSLRRVYAGRDTPSDAKELEWRRLFEFCRARKWSLKWAVDQYEKVFFERPSGELLNLIPQDERRAFYENDRAYGQSKGFKPGFPAARYRDVFGTWPPRSWESDRPDRSLSRAEIDAIVADRKRRTG